MYGLKLNKYEYKFYLYLKLWVAIARQLKVGKNLKFINYHVKA